MVGSGAAGATVCSDVPVLYSEADVGHSEHILYLTCCLAARCMLWWYLGSTPARSVDIGYFCLLRKNYTTHEKNVEVAKLVRRSMIAVSVRT